MANKKRSGEYSGAIGRLQVDLPFELLQWLEDEAKGKHLPKKKYVQALIEEAKENKDRGIF